MTRDTLQELIRQLRPATDEPAHFELYRRDGPDGFIRANQEGLRLFARELLEASLTLDYQSSGPGATQIPLGGRGLLRSSDLRPVYVQPWQPTDPLFEEEENKEPPLWKQQLTRYGVWLGALVLLASTGIGFFTILRWLF